VQRHHVVGRMMIHSTKAASSARASKTRHDYPGKRRDTAARGASADRRRISDRRARRGLRANNTTH
jgi:hypothetical protein